MLLSELSGVFAAYESGTKVPATGFTINGVDLADMFAPVAAGVPYGAATGFTVSGADLNTLFAAIGTTTKLSDSFKGYYSDNDIGQGSRTGSVVLTFNNDGTYSGAGRTGRWLAASIDASLYEIQISLTSGDALTTNGAATYQPFTGPRSCSLTVSSSSGYMYKRSVLAITIRKISAPTEKVDAVVNIDVSAESWGSSPYPP